MSFEQLSQTLAAGDSASFVEQLASAPREVVNASDSTGRTLAHQGLIDVALSVFASNSHAGRHCGNYCWCSVFVFVLLVVFGLLGCHQRRTTTRPKRYKLSPASTARCCAAPTRRGTRLACTAPIGTNLTPNQKYFPSIFCFAQLASHNSATPLHCAAGAGAHAALAHLLAEFDGTTCFLMVFFLFVLHIVFVCFYFLYCSFCL